jgi:hypothetical protein
MSCRSATSHPCAVWRQDDGLPNTVAALLHNIIKSPYIVACPLCMTSRLASCCRRHDVSMSYTYLMLPIRRVWLSYMYLLRYLLRMSGKVMMGLMSDVLRMHRHASEASGPDRVSRPAEYFPFAYDP